MTKNRNRSGQRIISLFLAVLTLIALVLSLSACSGETEKISTQTKDETDADFVARVISSDNVYKLRFAAAFRGYDITAEDFEDSEEDKGANTEYGKKVLKDALAAVKFANEPSDKPTFENYISSLTAETMADVINSKQFKENYELEHKNGFPSILLVWIGKFLGILTDLVGNYYVIAIIIFAIIIEIIMLPMSIKQQKNSIGMAKLRPQIARIEKKYAGRTDQVTQRKKQEEIMELQQKSGYSPFSGCMPLLVQLIVVGFILYPIIQNPLRYVLDESTGFSSALMSYATSPKAAGGLGLTVSGGNVMELLAALTNENMQGIANFSLIGNGSEILAEYTSLSIPDFTAFGINLGKLPSFTSILILIPLFNVVGQWASMYLTRKWTGMGYNQMGAQDSQEKFSLKLMDILPLLMTVFILFKVPAMIGVYWFFRSLISLAKQYIMKTIYPVPKYTEEEIREIEKAEKERQKAQKAALKQQPKYRSLHYIDEDDYDELPTVKQNNAEPKKFSPSEAPEIKD